MTVSISVLAQLVRYLAHLKADVEAIFRAAGADPEILRQPDSQLPIEQYIAIEERAARDTEDPCFGLHMGEFFESGNWSILGYMMMNCSTLIEAFSKSARYQRIIGTFIGTTIQWGIRKVRITLTVPKHAPVLSRHCLESALSSSLRMIRLLTGKPYRPIAVGFSHPQPASTDEYARVFGCPVSFSHKDAFMILDRSLSAMPVLLPNARMLEYFESYARENLADTDGIKKTTRRALRIILENLDKPGLSLGYVSGEMGMSVRALQGRLKDEGEVFSELLRQTRERLAKKYLAENYTVEDITYLLGFSDASVFRKSFKKWSGQTPREFRIQALSSPLESR